MIRKILVIVLIISVIFINTTKVKSEICDKDSNKFGIIINKIATKQELNEKKDKGYKFIGRYLNEIQDKESLSINELRKISELGLSVFPIYNQQGNLSKEIGKNDAEKACQKAKDTCIGQNGILYFEINKDKINKTQEYIKGIESALKNSFHNEYKYGIIVNKGNKSELINLNISNYIIKEDDENDKIEMYGEEPKIALNTNYRDYDRNKSIEYAKKFYNKFNTDMNYQYSSDCANFISQCLNAGGIKMTAAWYSTKSNNKSDQTPENADTSKKFDIGEPWRLAREQYKYFKNPQNGYINGDVIKIEQQDNIQKILKVCKDVGKPIQKGDILFFSTDKNSAHHATIISEVTDQTLFFSSHSEPFISKNIIDGLSDMPGDVFYIVRINDKNL